MEGYHPIVAHMLTANYLAVFMLWYFAYGTFAYNFSYEGTRGGFFLPLYALADDLYLQLPGRKAAFIRKQVDEALAHGWGGGYLGGRLEDDWSYENVRKNDLYSKVGSAMLPGTFYVLIITAPLLYPAYSWAWKSLLPSWDMSRCDPTSPALSRGILLTPMGKNVDSPDFRIPRKCKQKEIRDGK